MIHHLMQTDDSLEKSLMLGKKAEWKGGIRWPDNIMEEMNMNFGKLQETVRDREAWHSAVHGVTESDTTG